MTLANEEKTLGSCIWIWHPACTKTEQSIVEFQKTFSLKKPETLRFHVSADQRYKLFVDGAWIGVGPSRGSIERWFYETYTVKLAAGKHVIKALAWWLLPEQAPGAQLTEKRGLFLAAEGKWGALLSTGQASWQCRKVEGIGFNKPKYSVFTGHRESHSADTGHAEWVEAANVHKAVTESMPDNPYGVFRGKTLFPSMIPKPFLKNVSGLSCRFAETDLKTVDFETVPVLQNNADLKWVQSVQNMLNGKSKITFPAQTSVRKNG